ncbi:MAG: hypothetical protein ACI4LP_09835 [Anaerovoracaceae bacterium]
MLLTEDAKKAEIQNLRSQLAVLNERLGYEVQIDDKKKALAAQIKGLMQETIHMTGFSC